MRSGWVGNERLQTWLQRADPRAAVTMEAVRTVNTDVRWTKTEWGNSTGTGFTLLRDGGIKLSGSRQTVAAGTGTENAQIITNPDLNPSDSFGCVRIRWDDGIAGTVAREIDRLIVRVDPDTGAGVEVTEWRAQLFRMARLRDEGVVTLQPISAQLRVAHGGGASEQDVTFDFLASERGHPVRIGSRPVGASGDDLNPRTYVFLWALKGDGEAAASVAWMGDSGTNQKTGSGYIADAVTLERVGGAVAQAASHFTEDANGVAGVPSFTLQDVSFSSATRSMTGGDKLDLGAAPTEDIEVVLGTQVPASTSVTAELSEPGAGVWHEVVDGDIIGEDNTPDEGSDLSGLAVRQDYDARVTLTPPGASFTTPVVRRFGIRERESTMLHELASLREYRQAVDPVDGHSEIGSALIELVRDGVTDYRDFFSDFFSSNHIGQVEFRAWVGGRDLPRRYWLHLDDFLVDDHASRGEAGTVEAVNALALLGGIIPDPQADPKEPLEYENSTISAAYSDILSNQLALLNRRIGTGPVDIQIDDDDSGAEDTDALVTKRIEEAKAKPELDALVYLSGGSIIASQGRIQVVQLHNDVSEDNTPHPVDVIPMEENRVREVSPGYSERVDEFFVSWGWDPDANDGRGAYTGEERDFHSPALTKLTNTAIRAGDVPRPTEEAQKWIPQSGTDGSGDPFAGLARKVAGRQVETLGTGMITVPVDSTVARPHLELGDVVAVETDRLVARDPSTDRGVRGVAWLIGPVVAIDDPLGRRLTVWVRSYANILPSAANIQRQKFVVPRVNDLAPSFSSTGVLSAAVTTRLPDTGSVRVAAAAGSDPLEATVDGQTAQAVDADGSVVVGSLGTFSATDVVHIAAKAYENADGTGRESFDVYRTRVTRLPFVPPKLSVERTEAATDGTATFRIRDESLRASAVEFQTKTGPGDFGGAWVSTWDTSNGSAGSDRTLTRTETVTKDEKHVTAIKCRVSYTDAEGNADQVYAETTFDPEEVAEITDATITFTSHGNVGLIVIGDTDCANIYVTIGNDTSPADPTAAVNDGTVSGRSGVINSSVKVDWGNEAKVKVVADNSSGILGPVREFRVRRGDAASRAPDVNVEQSQSGSLGSLDLTITDLSLAVTAVQYKQKTGPGGYDANWSQAWDRSTGTAGTDTTLTRGEDINLTAKHNVAIKFRITYTDEDDTIQTIVQPVVFDSDEIAEVSGIEISIDDSSVIHVSAKGDEDTSNMYVTANSGSAPSDPTAGANDGVITGQSGNVNTGVVAGVGDTIHVKVVAENSDGELGPVVSHQRHWNDVFPGEQHTGANPVFTGVLSVESNAGVEQYELGSGAGGALFQLRNAAGTVKSQHFIDTDDSLNIVSIDDLNINCSNGALTIDVDPGELIAQVTGDIELESDGGVHLAGGGDGAASAGLEVFGTPSTGADLTGIFIRWYNGTSTQRDRVEVGPTDSGGSGYRVLRILN